MKKFYNVFADWRQKDVRFINTLDINKKIELGYDHFGIEEGRDYQILVEYYSKKDPLFGKTKPKEFSIRHATCIFSKEDLDNAKYYAISSISLNDTPESRFPQPIKNFAFVPEVFNGNIYKIFDEYEIFNKKQKAPFKIKKPKWKKKEVCFDLGICCEYTLFKKEFYQEVLAPLGLQSMKVLNYKTGKPLEDTVQLVIPIAKSKLLLEGSAYDIEDKRETRGYKQYALQTLDFFPPFEKDFDFHICYSQEYFGRGQQRIIISKEFCNLLVKYNIIEYSTNQLTPLKNK